jgi:hypothetical protein
MTIKRSDIDFLVNDINEQLKNFYLSNIDKIVARKDQKGFCIEYIINGKQSNSFYANLSKNQIYIFLETLNRLLYKNVTITGCTDTEDQKKGNTDLIVNLIEFWNKSNI